MMRDRIANAIADAMNDLMCPDPCLRGSECACANSYADAALKVIRGNGIQGWTNHPDYMRPRIALYSLDDMTSEANR